MIATSSKSNVSQYDAKINTAYAIAMQQHMHNLHWRKYGLTLRKMTQGKSYTTFAPISAQLTWLIFLRITQTYRIRKLCMQGYIFHILQHLITKLGNVTTFKMLFQAVVMIVLPLPWIKIYFIMLIVHLR